jgi:DNA processing protein
MVTPADRDALLRLACSGLNPMTAARLLASSRPEVALRGLLSRPGEGRVRRELEVTPSDRRRTLAAIGAVLVARDDEAFPAWLASLPDAPHWLFVHGILPPSPGVAVVGSRKATTYGSGVAARIGGLLAGAGVSVISGMATGIDGAAHRGALAAGGHTVAVLGSGIDVWYPARHRPLAGTILDSGGAIVSEYPPGAAPEPWRFPLRNRIVSGLSRAVVVVEAAERSGALITARLALEQNLDVFAVPGDIERETSRGCNLLIRDGAHPLTAAVDLLDALGLEASPAGAGGVFGLRPGESVALDELVERMGGGEPGRVFHELGRLELDGRVTVREGVVRALPDAGKGSP